MIFSFLWCLALALPASVDGQRKMRSPAGGDVDSSGGKSRVRGLVRYQANDRKSQDRAGTVADRELMKMSSMKMKGKGCMDKMTKGRKGTIECSKPTAAPTGQPTLNLICAATITSATNGHEYILLPVYMLTCDEAKSGVEQLPLCCGGKEAHLATISDAAENSFVDAMLRNVSAPFGVLGFDDSGETGTYGWVTGESVPYVNWVSFPIEIGFAYLVSGEKQFWYSGSRSDVLSQDFQAVIEYDCE